MWLSGGRECQEEKAASAEALRWECAWIVPETVKKLGYLEGSEQGDKTCKKMVGCGGEWERLDFVALCALF